MARPKKKGLEYFPMDVDIFEDDKLFDVQNEYGPLGEVIYIRLLCLVYKNGYYYRFDSLDKLASMIIRSVGNRWARDKKTVTDVISYLAECNLFSKELMCRNILTSRSIQMRYLSATERRQSHISEYNLLEETIIQEGLEVVPLNKVNVTETVVNTVETSKNVTNMQQSKVKESKVNKSKVCMILPATNGNFEVTQKFHEELTHTYPETDIDACLNKMQLYLQANQSKQRDIYHTKSYIRMWISSDAEKGKNKKPEGYEATYDISDYESSSVLDEV